MFRKGVITVVASLALLAPFALPSMSEAKPVVFPIPVPIHHYHRPYVYRAPVIQYWNLFYRSNVTSPWVLQGTYTSYYDASLVAQSMHGVETMIQ